MTQEDMNMVIAAAISFGMNNDMSGELHDVKTQNLELMMQINKQSETIADITKKNETLLNVNEGLRKMNNNVFQDASTCCPEDTQLYLCIVDRDPACLLTREDLRLLTYDSHNRNWYDADMDTFEYNRVKYFSMISCDNFVYER